MISIIDSLASGIEAEIPRHISKWGTFIDTLSITEWGETSGISSIESWKAEIQKFRTFAEKRPASAIQNLSDLFSLSGRSTLSISSNIQGAGKLDVNGFFKDLVIHNQIEFLKILKNWGFKTNNFNRGWKKIKKRDKKYNE